MPVRCLKITIWTWNQKESLKKIFLKKTWLTISCSASEMKNFKPEKKVWQSVRFCIWLCCRGERVRLCFSYEDDRMDLCLSSAKDQFKNWLCTAKIYTAPVKSFDTLSHSREYEAVLNFWLVLYKGQTWQESTVVIYFIIFIYIR